MNSGKYVQLCHQNHNTDYFCYVKVFVGCSLSSLDTYFLIITDPLFVSILSPPLHFFFLKDCAKS